MPSKPSIGIIGSGNVGSALQEGLVRAGYDVDAAGHEPERVAQLARNAEVVILAVPFDQREDALRSAGDLTGKILVDATNAMDKNMGYALDLKQSGAEQLAQKAARGAKVVKAFNTVFAQNMSTGKVQGERLTALIAGDDEPAKRTVMQLAKDLGFDPVDAGPLAQARYLETLGVLNINLAYKAGMGPAMGFRLVHEGSAVSAPTRETLRNR